MQYQAPLIESEDKLLYLVDYHIRCWSQETHNLDHLKSALIYFDKLYSKLKSRYIYTSSVQFLISHAAHLQGILDCYSTDSSHIPLNKHLSNMLNEEHRYFVRQENENSRSLTTYLDNLQRHYSRLLAVRVDLSYSKGFHETVNVNKFQEDMRLFLSRISNKKGCFKHLHGYAWALEQGAKKGYHCHLLLLYDGSKRQKDYYLGREVGECWMGITNGRGSYFNCNDPAYLESYQMSGDCGIGMIHRSQEHQRINLNNTAQYLTLSTKFDQRLLVKTPSMRTFGHGIFPTSKHRGVNS